MKLTIVLSVIAIFTLSVFADVVADDTIIEDKDIANDGFSVADKSALKEENFKFQAEIDQLMKIIINSLYSNRDIFLRELISNAADAISKIRFLSLSDKNILGDNTAFEIKIKVDPENKQIHIRDTGIGMTRQDLINNLGNIAKSGTKEFLEKMKSSTADLKTIGQFGVGFYSSFLVADRVTVTTKHNDDEQYIWESTASETTSFTIAKDPRGNTLGRGTLITLHLKDDAAQYLDVNFLRDLVLHFNEFISYPIYVWNSRQETREIPQEVIPQETKEEDGVNVEEVEEDSEEKTPKTTSETVWYWDYVNTNPPIWTRPKSEITEEEYNSFYKDVLKDTQDPLHYVHFKAEGDAEFTSLMYIPKSLPQGYWEPGYKSSMKLYVKRVFITDNFSDLLPGYMNFLKGIVDSDDIDLNVSREMLQQSKTLGVIKKKLARKVIAMLQELSQKEEKKYSEFYSSFGTNVKLGVIQDTGNRDRLAKLLKFHSAKNPGKLLTFDEYIKSMKKGQEEIYYLGGESLEVLRNSPHLERLRKRGYDVLLLVEPIDEYCVTSVAKFDKYKLTDISKEGLKLSGDDEERQKEVSKDYEPLTTYLKEQLSDKVSKVEVSIRLTTSPATLASSSYGYSANMERILKAQALRDDRFINRIQGKKVLEINPKHPIVKKLLNLVQEEKTDSTTTDIAYLLYDTAVINSGYALDEPTDLTNRVTKLVSNLLSIDPNEKVEEDEEAEAEEKQEEKEEEEENGDNEENNEEEVVVGHEDL